jgi:alkanesulfonate monooxygenase SsuD/methylene tetrahydromethanopterin reductase-like flavin-dependent oxidoreductase (luciferase family)
MKRGLGVAAGPDPVALASLGREAEALGYAAIWSNDHPGGEGLLQLSQWAGDTHGIDLCVGVLALDRHQPAGIAARVTQLELPHRRLLLGIGAGLQPHQLGAVRAGVEELRRLLPGVRLAVAAMGPRMCELAGELADAVLLNWMTPERIAYVRVALGPDAGERLALEAGFYAQLPAYARNFEAAGVAPGSIGIAVADPADLPPNLAAYAALDLAVVRVLSDRTPGAVLEVARAATGQAVVG